MKTDASLTKCRSYIDIQWQSQRTRSGKRRPQSGLAITISRQTGSGARSVAGYLAAYLDRYGPSGPCPWTVFDRSLVEKVLEEHNLPKEFAKFMPEDRRSYIDDVMGELVGLHPPSWTLVRQTTETILDLAEMGQVILVGRGANVITAKLPGVMHVRLIGSIEKRAEHAMAYYKLDSLKAARQRIRKEDRGRERYLRKHFQASIDDDLLYHLVINTDRIPHEAAAEIIGQAALQHFKRVGEA